MNTVLLVFCSLLSCVGATSNLFLILAILKTKGLRVMINVFTAVLAFVDLITLAYLLPFNIYTIQNNEDVLTSTFLCRVNGFITHILFTCSVQCIAMISASRYVKICQPQYFDTVFAPSNVFAIFLYCVLFNIAFGTPLTFDGQHIIYEKQLHMCIFNRYSNGLHTWAYVITCLLIPIIGTIVFYLKTYLYISRIGRRSLQEFSGDQHRLRIKRDLKLTRIQFCAFVIFLILHFPFAITCLFRRDIFPNDFHTIGIYLIFSNAFVNSVLYGICNTRIREVYVDRIGRLLNRLIFVRRHTRETVRIHVIPPTEYSTDTTVDVYQTSIT